MVEVTPLKLLPLKNYIINGLMEKYMPREFYMKQMNNPNPGNQENDPPKQAENQENVTNNETDRVEYYDPAYGSIQRVDLPQIPEPPKYITVDIDELSQFLKAIEQMKLPELRSSMAQMYLKHEQMKKWVDSIKDLYEAARMQGQTKLLIPYPPINPQQLTQESDPVMREFFKVLAPIVALKELGGSEGKNDVTINDIVNAVRTIKDMADSERKSKMVKINVEGLGDIEVTPEFALLYYTMTSTQSSTPTDYVIIERSDGSREHVPKDLYILQFFKEITSKKKEEKGEKDESLTGKLLKTIESLSNAISNLSKRLDDLEKRMESKKGSLEDVTEMVEQIVRLRDSLNLLFGDESSKKEDKYELIKLLASSKEEEEKKVDDIDARIQRARQLAESVKKPKTVVVVKKEGKESGKEEEKKEEGKK